MSIALLVALLAGCAPEDGWIFGGGQLSLTLSDGPGTVQGEVSVEGHDRRALRSRRFDPVPASALWLFDGLLGAAVRVDEDEQSWLLVAQLPMEEFISPSCALDIARLDIEAWEDSGTWAGTASLQMTAIPEGSSPVDDYASDDEDGDQIRAEFDEAALEMEGDFLSGSLGTDGVPLTAVYGCEGASGTTDISVEWQFDDHVRVRGRRHPDQGIVPL